MGRRVERKDHHLRQAKDGVWYLVLRVEGRQREFTLGTKSVEAARKKRDKALREHAEGRFHHPSLGTNSTRDTVSKLIDDYIEGRHRLGLKAVKNEQRALEHLKHHIGTLVLAKVTTRDVEDAVLRLQNEPSPLSGRKLSGATPSTIAGEWRAFFRWACKALELRDPCDGVAPRAWPVRPEKSDCNAPLKDDEMLRLVNDDRVDVGLLTLISVTWSGALRIGETLGLTWGDINFDDTPMPSMRVHRQLHADGRFAALKEDKRNQGFEKQMPLHPDAVAFLSRWKVEWGVRYLRVPTAADPVFPARDGHVPLFASGKRKGWTNELGRAAKLVGVRTPTWHSFKAFMADRLHIEAECTEAEVQLVTHPFSGRSKSSVGRYLRTEFEKRCQYVSRLPSLLREPAPVIPLRQLAASGSHEPSMTASEGETQVGNSGSDAGTMLGRIRKSDLKTHKALEFRLVKEPAENGQKWWNVRPSVRSSGCNQKTSSSVRVVTKKRWSGSSQRSGRERRAGLRVDMPAHRAGRF